MRATNFPKVDTLNNGAANRHRRRAEAARERRGDPLPNAITYCTEDACRIGGFGKTTLYALLKAGKLRALKLGAKTLIDGDSLRALLRGPTGVEG
jgi:excisionase family DNA binding protein